MVDGISSSLNGMQNAIGRISQAAQNIGRANATPAAGEKPISLDEQVVESSMAAVQFKTNAKALKAQLDVEMRLLDTLA
ncbi:MAG TPA: hypothetical protein VHB73_01085 [Alphaproteobacteria bacterium]|nr:hypothetical protein [Alphaproteobacteria bacterium]